jgi:hypothetical protein
MYPKKAKILAGQEKKSINTKISSILVVAKAVIPIPTRLKQDKRSPYLRKLKLKLIFTASLRKNTLRGTRLLSSRHPREQ